MPNPAEDIPANGPTRWGNRGFQFGAFRLGVAGAVSIGAMVELADQLHRTFQGMKAAIPMVADIHHASTGWTSAVNDVEFPQCKIGIRRPLVRHPADLHVLVRSVNWEGTTKQYAKKTRLSSSLSSR
jgi:hypothetical protein